MHIRRSAFVFAAFALFLFASSFGSSAFPQPVTQYPEPVLDLPPDPDGESSATVTLTNSSGDPSGTTSVGYVLDDGSVVINMAGVASGSQSVTYTITVDEVSNTYAVAAGTPQDIPPCIAGSVRLSTIRKSDGTEQVRTVDRLIWRIVNGTIGYTSYLDGYQAVNGGGLTWNIVKSPDDPPYTTSPFNANLINDTGNGKYKNFNFGDPNLSTVAVHFIRIDKEVSDGDFVFRWEASHKVKNEAPKKFKARVCILCDLPNPPSC